MKQIDVANIVGNTDLVDEETLRYERNEVDITYDEEDITAVVRLLGDSVTQVYLHRSEEEARERYQEKAAPSNGVVAVVRGVYKYRRHTSDLLRYVEVLEFKGDWADK